jgi:predicted O-linked N-acetylglucosamine transferase (SPINDLY family)
MDLQSVYNQAQAAQKAGNLAEAEQLYRQMLGHTVLPEVLVNLGNVLAAQNRREEALASYDKALLARPDFFEALFNRANTLLELKRPEGALGNYDQVVTLRPDFTSGWNNRGTALRNLQRLDEALASFSRAAVLSPTHINALTNVAIVLWDLGRLGEALAASDRALTVVPNSAEALYIKANTLRDLKRLDEALAHYEMTLAADPAHQHALTGAAQMALGLCDWQRVDALGPRVKDNAANGPAIIQPLVLLGYSDDAALQRRCAEHYVRRTVPPRPALTTGTRYRHDRIRLAYLSADFHQHPTAQLLAELFERHDRGRFEVTGIAFGPDDGSAMRARMRQAFDHFEDVRGRSDAEVATLLKARETDIAVDLNGHTAGARTSIFAYRPTPVQVNYLVYPGTIGADFIDTVLADRIVLPADQQPFFREKIVHLPDCYQANNATRGLPPAPARADAGLPGLPSGSVGNGFVFCCFNASWKITRALFDVWMRLLGGVDNSVLWLLDGQQAPNLRDAATSRGINPDRLIFAPRLASDQHLARHQLADLFLDTLPYNAHTTCSDALWAGVPVVTCYGKAFPGRVAASLLKAIDLPELVTARLEDYEALALELAGNPALLKATREKLKRNRLITPLYDSERFRQNIEAAYEAMLSA